MTSVFSPVAEAGREYTPLGMVLASVSALLTSVVLVPILNELIRRRRRRSAPSGDPGDDLAPLPQLIDSHRG
jgi:hypothetical protein